MLNVLSPIGALTVRLDFEALDDDAEDFEIALEDSACIPNRTTTDIIMRTFYVRAEKLS